MAGRRLLDSCLVFSILSLLATPARAQSDLVVDGVDQTLGGVHTYNLVRVINGGRIIVPAYDGSDRVNTGNLQIRANSIFVDASSAIIADGKGYQPRLCDNGPGPAAHPNAGGRGGCAVLDSGGGGAHFGGGGRGTKDCFCFGDANTCQFPQEWEENCGNRVGDACVGTDSSATSTCPAATGTCYNNDGLLTVAGQPYKHSIYEVEFGAAGGDKGCRDGYDARCSVGGAGGGRIALGAINDAQTGSLNILGRVSAEGWRGCGKGNDSGGGGAGGSLLIVGDNVNVGANAYVSAAGGLGGDTTGHADCPDAGDLNCPDGAQSGGTCDDCGGGGGGGIISVLSRSSATLADLAVFDVRGRVGGTCPICRGEAGGGAGELQLSGKYSGEFCDGWDNDFDGSVDEGLGTVTCGPAGCQTTVQTCDVANSLPNDCVPPSSPGCQSAITDTRARFMVIADTSGSMLTDLNGIPTYGDGSAGHIGLDTNGDSTAGNDSRLYQAKEALTEVISAYPEIDFGLSRFAQGVGSNINCQLAHWFECAGLCCTYDDPTNNTGTSPEGPCTGQYADTTLGSPNFGRVNAGSAGYLEIRPSSAPGEECINYAGSCGAVRRGADVLVGFERPINQSLMWLDHKETSFNANTTEGNHCLGGDCELRATGPTPLADSLYSVKAYLARIRAGDSIASCRGYGVILLTDGTETCDGAPTAAAAELLGLGINTYVVGFSVLATEQTALNQIAAAGGTGSAFFANNKTELANALATIVAGYVRFEKCNGIDDDCDGLIDEDFPVGQACDNGKLGPCYAAGVYECDTDDDSRVICNATDPPGYPTLEVCNGIDDDCNGLVDDVPGGCSSCVPQTEICDGRDNDCDTLVDQDDPDLVFTPETCGISIGVCQPGNTVCNYGVSCSGGTGPAPETCNGLDDNCDTVRDNFSVICFPPGSGNGCTENPPGTWVCQGVCQVGSQRCTAQFSGTWQGVWGSCDNYVGRTTEVCNGLDDDCDDEIDEGVSSTCVDFNAGNCTTTYTKCGACPDPPPELCNGEDDDCNGTPDDNPIDVGQACGEGRGECTQGTWQCILGGRQCNGGTGPFTETCNNKDDDCDGVIDNNIAGMGVVCGSNTGECSQGTLQCVAGSEMCVGEIGPKPEICDNKDNNCDGQTDNGVPGATCGTSVGECQAGTTQCVNGVVSCGGGIGPSAEICDGLDNNCNGVPDDNPAGVGGPCGTDEGECQAGVTECIAGGPVCTGEVPPSDEVCDGLDNDCDTEIDEELTNQGEPCGSDVGECEMGAMTCEQTAGGWAMVCAGAVGPTLEVCDGLDNDCDLLVDEDFPEKGLPCAQNVGECKAGTYICDNGNLLCDGGSLPEPEICDGLDNDCNGAIDDNVSGEGLPCGTSVGECEPGTTKCVGGEWICVGGVQPSQEICDGKDNDCDGNADEAAECPGESTCIEGQCFLPCATGEFACPGGTKCQNGYCISDECAMVKCTKSQRCVAGACVEKCANVGCGEHERCEPTTGLCTDDSCLTKGCEGEEVCIAYECVENPCAPGTCEPHQQCTGGECLETCLNVDCPKGQFCVQGKCTAEPCERKDCPSNHTCELKDGEAQCVADPCRVINCPPGQICRLGECLDDPCATSTCPEGTRCELSNMGKPVCLKIPGVTLAKTTKILATGGGGCSGCQLNSRNGERPIGSLLLIATLGLLLLRRRRRLRKGVRQ